MTFLPTVKIQCFMKGTERGKQKEESMRWGITREGERGGGHGGGVEAWLALQYYFYKFTISIQLLPVSKYHVELTLITVSLV